MGSIIILCLCFKYSSPLHIFLVELFVFLLNCNIVCVYIYYKAVYIYTHTNIYVLDIKTLSNT